MAKYTLNIEDEDRDVLLRVAQRMKVPEGLSQEEVMETAINHICLSLDAIDESMDGASDASPMDAKELREHIEQQLNPSIATTFTQPEGEAKPVVESLIPYEEILKLAPTNALVQKIEGDKEQLGEALYEFSKAGISLVFSKMPHEEWGSDLTKNLVARTIGMLLSGGAGAGAPSPKNGG